MGAGKVRAWARVLLPSGDAGQGGPQHWGWGVGRVTTTMRTTRMTTTTTANKANDADSGDDDDNHEDHEDDDHNDG